MRSRISVGRSGRPRSRHGARAGVLLANVGLILALLPAVDAQALTVQEFPVPAGATAVTYGIALGSDGNLWFTEASADNIGRITTTGSVTEFPITFGAYASDITAGADGNLWFTEQSLDQIGRITTTGTVTEFPLAQYSAPQGITAGPDGNVWFTELAGESIGRITPKGKVKLFPIGTDAYDITTGSDGNLWFTSGDGVGRITPSGTVTEFPVPTPSFELGITAGPDGDLWFTESDGSNIGRITTAGAVTEFPTLTPHSYPVGIAAGPDGNLWFIERSPANIATSTTSGTITEYAAPPGNFLSDITAGPDGNMWYTDGGGHVDEATVPHPDLSVVSYIPNRFFIPNVTPLAQQGDEVRWLFLNPGTHGIQDATGMDLFSSRLPVPIGGTYGYSFDAAGIYRYRDSSKATAKGEIHVPIGVTLLPGSLDHAEVVFASAPPPAGFVYDVQVMGPAGRFMTWLKGVTVSSSVFGPGSPHDVGPGVYSFRARIRNVGNGKASSYSDPGSVTLA